MDAPSRWGTSVGGISSHCNSGAGKSEKVMDKNLSGVRSFLPLTSSLCKIWDYSKFNCTNPQQDLTSLVKMWLQRGASLENPD